MPGLRPVFAWFACSALAVAVVVTISISPVAGAADATVEAESMKVSPTSGASTVRDSAASGGVALVLSAAVTASTTVALPASASIVIRAKGQQCNGAPTMNLTMDGRAISTTKVSTSSWTNFTSPTNIAAGTHTIGIVFPNAFRFFFCTRALSLDRVTIVGVASTTTPSSSTPTSSSTPGSSTPTSPPTPTGSPTAPTGDATAWLQTRFDAIKPGETLTLEPRTYQHSGVLKLRVAGARIDGNGATLQATSDSTSAVQLLADNDSLANLTLAAPLTGSRYSTPDQHKLFIQGNGANVSDVTINGSAAAGVFVYGATNFTLNRVTVRNTRADGIHMTNGANNGQVNNAVTEWTGDDGVAVVSYGSGPICHDIVIDSPKVNGTTWGRGISVVGGQNISYRNIAVSQSSAAGVYIATEGNSYNTLSVSNVNVTGGTVTGANTSTQVIHGAVLVYSGNSSRSLTDVTISGLAVAGTPSSAQRNVGFIADTGTVGRIAFTNIALQNTNLPPFMKSSSVPAGSYRTSGWTLNGTPINVG
jgi:hypothetical protein